MPDDVVTVKFVIAMEAPEIAASVRAGQFVNLGWSPGPLLRRPFSVYRTEGDRIEVILKAIGAGTAHDLRALNVTSWTPLPNTVGTKFQIACSVTPKK